MYPVLAQLAGRHVQIVDPILRQQAQAAGFSLVAPHGLVHQSFQPFGFIFLFPIVQASGLDAELLRQLSPPSG